ncbi:MAG TPA: putative Ig domain-containing protein [Blastocatellia bacterium]|nr:putative Ig domain-containing protein [Blastocatellia bacterium]
MLRVVLLCCVLLLLLTATGPIASAQTAAPVEGMKDYTLILVDAETADQLSEARDFIAASGGTVAVVLPPKAIFGWVPPAVADRIVGQHRIRAVQRSVINTPPAGFRDRVTQMAIRMFNDMASGRAARRRQRDAARPAGPQTDRPGFIDTEPHPKLNRQQMMESLQRLGIAPAGDVRTQFFGNSDVMDGTVAVALFLIESNGAADPNLYSWSNDDTTTAVTQTLEGLNWWVEQSRAFQLARPLQFTLVPHLPNDPVSQVPYEPILHPASDATFWIAKIMSNLGIPEGDVVTQVAVYDQMLRQQQHTDWAYSIFVGYNPIGTATAFTDHRSSWAFIGGPYVQSLFRSFGWPLSRVVSHESGHIFYACDEYFQPGYQTCSCSCAPEVRRDATNGNCQDTTCNPNSTACMMRLNELALCPHTAAQIGWINQLPPPPPTAPAGLVATASSPTEVTLVWQDTSAGSDGAAQGFQIERRGGTSADFTLLATTPTTSPRYTDGTALPNTAYAYRVRAFNISGQSGYSNEVPVITPTVTPSLTISTTSMPDATVAVAYDRALVASGGKPDYLWIVDSGTLPTGLTLSQAGNISGTPSVAGTSNFVVKVTDGNNNSATRALTIIVKPAAPLTITTAQLPRGSVGTTYSQSLGASGGQTPYNWAKLSGNLPDGLTLNQTTGVISGVPERAGTSSFSIRLTDATAASVTATLAITINPAISTLEITTESLPDAVVGQDYARALQAAGGSTPYRWAITGGRLPDGLQLSNDGNITGRPTTPGTANFTVQVTEQSGQTASKALTIDIEAPPQFTILSSNPLPPAAVGVPYQVQLQASAGSAPYTWVKKKKAKFGALPDGITLSSEGMLSGTPTTQGTSDFTVIANDAAERQAKKPLTIVVGPPPPPLAVRTETLPNATQGLNYTAHLEGTGGVAPYTWTLDLGTLPAGLTLQSDGTINGRASFVGTNAFTVRVKDAVGTTSTHALFILVVPPPPPLVIQTVQLPETSAERPYSQTLVATGGVPPYTWSIASGNLGQGLNLSASGVISGTPTSPGTVVFVVRVTDSAEQSVTRTLAITIRPADHVAPFGNLEVPDFRATLSTTATGSGWALDNVGIATVEVLIDGTKAGEAIYGLSRPDIGAIWSSFPNAARSGYSFTLDTTKFSNGEHTLAIRLLDASGNATVVGTRPITLQNSVFMITTTTLPRGRKGEAYSQQLQTANGRAPYTFTLISGALPAGLSLNASGLIAGTPTVFGSNFTFSVRATDANNAAAVASYAVTIVPDVDPLRVVTSGDLPSGLTGIDYATQLFYTGGRAPVTWALNSGTLPAGLTLNPATGVVSGRPTTVVNSSFTMRVTDADNTTAVSSTLNLSITLGPLGVIDTGTLAAGITGVDYAITLRGTGGTTPYRWTVNSGALPTGLTLNQTTGVIGGRPTVAGTFNFVIKITDNTSASALSDPLRIVVTAGPLVVLTTGDLPAAQVNVDYAFTLTANGGTQPYTWSLVTGPLPAGLTLNPATGGISGKPTAAGTFTLVFQVRDTAGLTIISTPLRLVVSP